MPLSPPANRVLRHRRAITAEAYLRDDGLWDIEARLTDTKPRDIELAGGRIRPEGQPLHDLWLRVTIDLRMNVVDAEACSDWVPYPTHCDLIGPAYRKLIGLNLSKGFRKAVRERLGSVAGCTHLTELAGVLPTAAIQAFAGDVFNIRDGAQDIDPEPPCSSMDATRSISRARWFVSFTRAGMVTSRNRKPALRRRPPRPRHAPMPPHQVAKTPWPTGPTVRQADCHGRPQEKARALRLLSFFPSLYAYPKGNTHEYP
jgi:hypothetical protein